jgi:ATPase subunit of ABC transporter with duplicated ATPase domains
VWDTNDRYAQRPGYAAILTDALPTLCGCKQRKDLELEEVEIPEGQDRGPILHDIDFELHHGRLLCVIGQVGSGKTSLMHAIMGEVDKVSGSVAVNGKLAYAAQSSFVMNMTLRCATPSVAPSAASLQALQASEAPKVTLQPLAVRLAPAFRTGTTSSSARTTTLRGTRQSLMPVPSRAISTSCRLVT